MLDARAFAKIFLISLPVFSVPNLLWFFVIANDFYFERVSHLTGGFDAVAIFLFHIVCCLGLAFFAIYPSLEKGTYNTALVLGSFFGFFTFTTIGLVNQSFVLNWPVSIVFTLFIWGVLAGGFASVVTLFVYKFFNKDIN